MKKVLLIDAFGIIFKSYYAFISRPLINQSGENSSAVFGYFKSLVSVLLKEKPDYYVIALEGEGKCFRNEIYSDYKANRDEAPEDLKEQIPRIFNLMEALGMPMVSVPASEADDVIGTVADKAGAMSDLSVRIFSSDKDLMQLVNDSVTMLRPEKTFVREMGEREVFEKMGVRPDQVVDYLALIGDSSDNIPGVKGVGPKTAAKLLAEHDTLDGIYQNIDEITSKSVKSKLTDDRENAYLSRELAQIKRDLEIDIDLEKWGNNPLNIEKAASLLEYDGLSSVVQDINSYNKELFGTKPVTTTGTVATDEETGREDGSGQEFLMVHELAGLEEHVKAITESGRFCFDLETTGFDFINDRIICMSIAYEEGAFVVPFHLSPFQEADLDAKIDPSLAKKFHKALKPLFSDPNVMIIGQNIKFDLKFMKSHGYEIEGPLFDTMLAEFCLDGAHTQLNMDSLAEKYLNYRTIKYGDIVPNTRKDTLLDVPLDDLIRYSGQDAWITWRLFKVLGSELEKVKELSNLYYTMEIPLLSVLMEMEYGGVCLEKGYLRTLSASLEEQLAEIHQKIMDEAGEEFNPNSPKQLAAILFEKLGLPVVKKTKTGASTDVDVLKKLSKVHPLPDLLLSYRELSKIKSTYSDALPTMVNEKSGRIHTTYMQTGAQTGRLASRDPNLQNIPVRSEVGRKVRGAFVPSPGNILISADYSQIELVLLAEFSRDDTLFDAFKNGIDIHTTTASLLFGKELSEVTREERTIGKTVNFGVLYGQSAFSLAEDLDIGRGEAQKFIDAYFQNYSGVREYIDGLKEQCRERGFAETWWGRRRSVPEIHDKNRNRRMYGERIAVNTTIQGTAADLIKLSMIRIQKRFTRDNLESRLIMQVHDELIFDVLPSEQERVTELIRECMEEGFDFELPLRTSVSTGINWGELK
jgi:DNA polymerase-1